MGRRHPTGPWTQVELDRFWAKVSRSTADVCWIWNNATDRRGYGSLTLRRKRWQAHRLSYLIKHGSIPTGLVVRHACDNPPCVNPDHLIIGTQRDNIQDCVQRDRMNRARGEDSVTARLTLAKVRMIRQMIGGALSGREIGRRFGVSHTTIQAIANRTRWTEES